MKTARSMYVLLVVCAMILVHVSAYAGQFTIAIMQDEPGAGKRYRPLQAYLASKGINFSFVAATNYSAAADMFASGKVDLMFSGSAIAGMFIMKDLATPLVRPVCKEGYSTYWAVIIARKGSPRFNGKADYFKGKRVILTPLASSGEIFYYSIPNIKSVESTIEKSASHGAVIYALSEGFADVAIVKNRIWDHLKSKYPNLILVGEDKGANPDNTLTSLKRPMPSLSRRSRLPYLISPMTDHLKRRQCVMRWKFRDISKPRRLTSNIPWSYWSGQVLILILNDVRHARRSITI